MEALFETIVQFMKTAGIRILMAVLIFEVGMFLTKKFKALLDRTHAFERLDASTKSFIKNTLILALRVLVVVTALITLGVPATSFITVLASQSALRFRDRCPIWPAAL